MSTDNILGKKERPVPYETEEKQQDIDIVSLSGRGPLNLLGRKSFLNLNSQLNQCEQDPSNRVAIVIGEGGRAFSAGVDLHEIKDLTPRKAESFIRALHESCGNLINLGKPTIAAIKGPCLGAGLELALSCDIRIGGEDSIFGLPEVRVGAPSVIEASLLPKTIGLGRARHLILTGNTINARQSLEYGLLDYVVSNDHQLEKALEVSKTFNNISREVISLQKDIIAKWLELSDTDSTEYSIKSFASNFASGFPKEAMNAFLEKRPPCFQ